MIHSHLPAVTMKLANGAQIHGKFKEIEPSEFTLFNVDAGFRILEHHRMSYNGVVFSSDEYDSSFKACSSFIYNTAKKKAFKVKLFTSITNRFECKTLCIGKIFDAIERQTNHFSLHNPQNTWVEMDDLSNFKCAFKIGNQFCISPSDDFLF